MFTLGVARACSGLGLRGVVRGDGGMIARTRASALGRLHPAPLSGLGVALFLPAAFLGAGMALTRAERWTGFLWTEMPIVKVAEVRLGVPAGGPHVWRPALMALEWLPWSRRQKSLRPRLPVSRC